MRSIFRRKTIANILSDHELAQKSGHQLTRTLGFKDLTAMGIAAIIGAGIFSTIGNASFNGGPAVVTLFIFTAIACGFSAMCYAEFASVIPISGSAYTYAYAAFGELVAWIIGWALIVEYAIGNIVVAISWSDYFTGLMAGLGWHIPEYFSMDYLSAKRGFVEASSLLTSNTPLGSSLQEAYTAWSNAPILFGQKIILDLPAVAIVLAITALIFRGVKETKNASNIMVGIKLLVVIMVIIVGAFYVNPDNWSPFSPNGMEGVMKGVSSVFFAYIGFDALATTAEECKDPKKDLPKSMVASLIICTILYILIALVLTGMVSYKELGVGDPLAFVFEKVNLPWMQGIVAVSAVIAMASVLLVFQNGQPRIWMSMSRDGLLPKKFSAIHPRFKTPWFATIITGILVAVPALFMNLREVTDLSSIGTLFAFVLVNAGVIKMESHKSEYHTGFRVPYINGKYWVPALFVLIITSVFLYRQDHFIEFFAFNNFWHQIPMLSFVVLSFFMALFSYLRNYSLIPVLGLCSNFYLMTELGLSNWIGFSVWLVLGLVIYFSFGVNNSVLLKKAHT
ncbi:MAG: amino acid transporter [Bacteroidetes bacterium B1(2017)]|nr:MAG: amino acid transporter [Bacteroidetes bacterium B1(2017)]